MVNILALNYLSLTRVVAVAAAASVAESRYKTDNKRSKNTFVRGVCCVLVSIYKHSYY